MPFFRHLNLVPTALAFTLVSAPALAQDEEDEAATETADPQPEESTETADSEPEESLEAPDAFPRLDVGVATGFNNPSGVLGFETHLRLTDYVGMGLMGGGGAWGFRLTPHARLYPLGVREYGFFLEGGLSMNFGGGETFAGGERLIYEPTPTLTTALGYRFTFMNKKAWGLLRGGYGFRLRQDNVHTVSGELPTVGASFWAGVRQHEGFLLGAAVGMALF